MYYPKSQIKTNLYTNGSEFIQLSTGQDYVGFYFETSTGKYYTGKNPTDIPNSELIRSTNSPVDKASLKLDSPTSILITSTGNKILPTSYNPEPTSQEYQIGEFRRYFVKKINVISYLEVSKLDYDNILGKNEEYAWYLYVAFNMPWQISGDVDQVARTNKNITELTSQRFKLPKLGDYLKHNYIKYYK